MCLSLHILTGAVEFLLQVYNISIVLLEFTSEANDRSDFERPSLKSPKEL
jgi:hypothetical protein